ncbi:class I SAM-dependent methyltransferase [Streptomyces bambusae]|uniref:Methyltransferase domain-containing protein n=1 Tax=Streptomyces bambusae TaxID=1550616 RepID=A0ABS6YZ93_9ACTN|nr:class I SAM-dependent methyltransferase [Streptomyces bambusae]MBW5480797.1 methyltransferase domain-containing protein [Streptomyces bambusae]
MSLFDSVDRHYARYRPRLPDQVVQLLARELVGAAAPRLLDLGAGTGQVALSMLPALPRTAHLDLVDQDGGMLRTALDELRPHLGERTATVHALPAEEFAPTQPGYQADLVTCCRAFHWMDRPVVLAMADRVAAPHAAVAIMGDGSLWTHKAEWTVALRTLIQSHLGEDRRAGTTGTYREPGRRYEDDLAGSAFSDIAEHRIPFNRAWTPRSVLGYLRSTSFARPDLFTDHAAFEEPAEDLLLRHAQDGVLHEDGVFTVLLARRPGVAR